MLGQNSQAQLLGEDEKGLWYMDHPNPKGSFNIVKSPGNRITTFANPGRLMTLRM